MSIEANVILACPGSDVCLVDMKIGCVYIMGNERPTLYVGVTSDLIKRVWEHKQEVIQGFTSRYHLHKLVYFEILDTIERAIFREKQIKNMNRKEKLELIRKTNPEFRDLYSEII